MRGKTFLASLGLVFLLTACTDETPGIIVSHVVYWDGNCQWNVSSENKIATGKYDVYCANDYYVALLVKSFTMSLADPIRPRSEPSIIQFDTVEVGLKSLAGEVIVDPFSTPVEGTVPPGTADEAGQGIVLVEAIPSYFAYKLNDFVDRKVIATFRLRGKTTGGTEVEVSEYTFPIQICLGCMTFFRSCTDAMSPETEADFQALTGCQGDHGYDGSVCICDEVGGGNECKSCAERTLSF